MNTKVLLMASSLLIAMNCMNAGQSMEYDFDGNKYSQKQGKSKLAQTNDSLKQKSRDFTRLINLMNPDQFKMEDFEIFLNETYNRLRNECKMFINSSEKSREYYFNTLIDMCTQFDAITVTHRLGVAIQKFTEKSDLDYSVKTILRKYNINTVQELLQSILKDKFKMEELMEQEYSEQENTLRNMDEELSNRKIELERQKEELKYFRDVSRGDIYTRGNTCI